MTHTKLPKNQRPERSQARAPASFPRRDHRRGRPAHRDLVLDEVLQAVQGVVPLPRDPVEILARVGEPLRLQLPNVLAPAAVAAHQAGFGEHVQVLLDRLTGDRGLRTQMRDRFGSARRPPCR